MRPNRPAAVAALAWCAVCGWFAFVRGTRVPLLGLVDLGFHELGHLAGYVLPVGDLATAAMGSLTQCAVPIGLACSFRFARRDRVGFVACTAWAATSLQDASVYVADAPHQRLELLGGEHDWAYVLGPEQLDVLHHAGTIAAAVWAAGLALALLAAAVACHALVPARPTRAPRARVPIRVLDPGGDPAWPPGAPAPDPSAGDPAPGPPGRPD